MTILQTLFSGLGGHMQVVSPMIATSCFKEVNNIIVFFGIEPINSVINEDFKGNKTYHILKKKKRYLLAFFKFFRIAVAENPNAIIIHSSELIIPAILFAKKNKNCRLIYVEHQSNQAKGLKYKILTKVAAFFAHSIVCLDEDYAKELRIKTSRQKKLKIITNGVNLSLFQPDKTTKLGKTLRIGMAGRMVPTKDWELLINSFIEVKKEIGDVQLLLAGEGIIRNKLEYLISKHGLSNNVTFTGYLNEKEMVKFYKDIDIYVQASNFETLCTAILQAMAMEKIVIAADIPNNRKIITSEVNGFFYKCSDRKDLTRKILHIATTGNFEQLRGRARKTIKSNYSAEKMAKEYLCLSSKNRN